MSNFDANLRTNYDLISLCSIDDDELTGALLLCQGREHIVKPNQTVAKDENRLPRNAVRGLLLIQRL